jgi:formate/nitrite transporter
MQTPTDVPGPSDPRLRNPDEAWKRTNLVWTRIYYGRAVMERIIDTIDVKHALQERYSYRYVMRAAMAGVIVALLYFFAYQVKADLGPAFNPGLAKYLTAASFSLALVLIYFTNSELLTSNFMYFTVGLYYGKIRARSTLTVLGLCLLGNLLGVVAIGLLARSAGMLDLAVRREILHTVTAKTVESGIWLIFVKAIFANYFINVAVIISMQVQEHLAKIAALLMGVTIFAYMGYEHVIANAALFATALLFDPGAVSPLHVGKNLLVSLVGNYVGGGLVVGLFYAYLNDDRRDAGSASLAPERG